MYVCSVSMTPGLEGCSTSESRLMEDKDSVIESHYSWFNTSVVVPAPSPPIAVPWTPQHL